jgi:DNA polymerase-1
MAQIDWTNAFKLERDVSILIREQERRGVYFNIGKAKYYVSLLEKMKTEKYDTIRPSLGYDIINLEKKPKGSEEWSYVKKITNKNGSYTASVTNVYDDPTICEGPFSRVAFEEPSISKRGLIIKQLLKMGWVPKEFTEKGFPKLTNKDGPVETLEKVGDFGKDLSLWYIYNHRQSQISGFLPHVRGDGRIAAQMNTCATNTFRCAHKVVANIPRPSSIFGKEMRGLFGVADNSRRFVGADASGLELRMLAHHMNDEAYIEKILDGDRYPDDKTKDIHTYNQGLAGLSTRDQAKTFIYGFLYGAGTTKLGSIVGGGSKQGKLLQEKFFESLPALEKLVNRVKGFAEKRGYLPSIDGRKIRVRSWEGKILVHTALNCLLQANGSILVKKAMVLAADEIKRRKLDAQQVIFYHDEYDYDSHMDCAEEVGEILIDSMRLAGEYFNLNIPISGKYQIGMDWSVH